MQLWQYTFDRGKGGREGGGGGGAAGIVAFPTDEHPVIQDMGVVVRAILVSFFFIVLPFHQEETAFAQTELPCAVASTLGEPGGGRNPAKPFFFSAPVLPPYCKG